MGRRPGYATLAVLRALAEGPGYGLDIMARTELPSGTVYPLLARLDRDGLARARWEREAVAAAEGRPRRRYHQLTARGRRELAAMLREWRPLTDPLPAPGKARPEEA